jgi:penicillin amidase
MEVTEAAPVLTQMLYRPLRSRLAENAAPKFGARYSDSGAPAAIESLLRQRPAGWFANWDEEVVGALEDAVEEGRRRYGRKMTNWTYGRVNEWTISHPIAARIPAIAPLFNIGPSPMSGSGNTVKQISARLGPSMRFVADLSNWDHSLLNIVTGESGHILSGHYRDQWEAYYNGTSFPFVFSHIHGEKTLLLRAAGTGVSGQ